MSAHRTRELADAAANEQRAITARLGKRVGARTVEIIETDLTLDETLFFCLPGRVDGIESCGVGWGAKVDRAPCPRCGFPALPVRELPSEPDDFRAFGMPVGDTPGTFVRIDLAKEARS